MPKDTRESQWEELYEALIALMSLWGRNQQGAGPCDYFIVDDDWGGWSQKICIVNPTLPMQDISAGIQSLLSSNYPRWNVIVVFEDATDREGMRILPDRVILESEDQAR